jgi:hypothetical protein
VRHIDIALAVDESRRLLLALVERSA